MGRHTIRPSIHASANSYNRACITSMSYVTHAATPTGVGVGEGGGGSLVAFD